MATQNTSVIHSPLPGLSIITSRSIRRFLSVGSHSPFASRRRLCPERLTNYRVELYADNAGDAGVLNWNATMRATAPIPACRSGHDYSSKQFRRHFCRALHSNRNNSGAAYNPQIAEVEVYALSPADCPVARTTNTISSGETALLHANRGRGRERQFRPGRRRCRQPTAFIAVQPNATTTYT